MRLQAETCILRRSIRLAILLLESAKEHVQVSFARRCTRLWLRIDNVGEYDLRWRVREGGEALGDRNLVVNVSDGCAGLTKIHTLMTSAGHTAEVARMIARNGPPRGLVS